MALRYALMLVALLVTTISVLRIYLRQTVSNFQRTHGRVTQANYDAVRTIWGAEQEQGELKVEIYTDEEVTERIESEDLTKPAVLRKKTTPSRIRVWASRCRRCRSQGKRRTLCSGKPSAHGCYSSPCSL